jgi:hypothetical protein
MVLERPTFDILEKFGRVRQESDEAKLVQMARTLARKEKKRSKALDILLLIGASLIVAFRRYGSILAGR